jgi:molybdopterin-binding protein
MVEDRSIVRGGVAVKISARNVFKGKVKKITHGMISTEVTVALAGGIEMVSVITKASAENLGLQEGKEVSAVIKATNVMIAVE